jgi:translation initiation factor IF-1
MSKNERATVLGTVVAVHGKFYQVKLDNGQIVEASPRGKLLSRKHVGKLRLKICVGDLIELEPSPTDSTKAVIVLKI